MINQSSMDYRPEFLLRNQQDQGSTGAQVETIKVPAEQVKMDTLRLEWQRATTQTLTAQQELKNHHVGPSTLYLSSSTRENLSQYILQRSQSATALQAASSDTVAKRDQAASSPGKYSHLINDYLRVNESNGADRDPQEQEKGSEQERFNKQNKKTARKLSIDNSLKQLHLSRQKAENQTLKLKTKPVLIKSDLKDIQILLSMKIFENNLKIK